MYFTVAPTTVTNVSFQYIFFQELYMLLHWGLYTY